MKRKKTHSIIGALAGGPVMAALIWINDIEISIWKAWVLGWLFSLPVATLDYYLGDEFFWRRMIVSVIAGAILGIIVWILFEPDFIPLWVSIIGFSLFALAIRESERFMERLVQK